MKPLAGTSFRSALKNSGRALRRPNYRLFFFGQSVSLIGTWIQRVAVGWLVYRLSGSEVLLGLEGFLSMAPALIISPIGGVLADRFNRRRLLLLTQVLALVQAAILAGLVLSGWVRVWQVMVLSGLLGVIHSADIPIRQAMVLDMVEDKEDLGNAIALNSVMFNVARLVGPTLAGFLIAWTGEGVCFLLNAVSFLGAVAALALMKIPFTPRPGPTGGLAEGLRAGFRYAVRTRPINSTLALLSLVAFFGLPYMILLPVFSKDVLLGDARTLGFLTGAVGLGALTGALFLASRSASANYGRIVVMAAALLATGLVVFGSSDSLLLSLAAVCLVGFGQMVTMASCNTIIQYNVDEAFRGRVMSLYAVSFRGTAPLGNLVAGAAAAAVGAPFTVAAGGLVCLFIAGYFAARWRKETG